MQKSSFLKKIHFKAFDVIIFAVFLTITIFSIVFLQSNSAKKPTLIVSTPFGQYIYDLEKDRNIQIKGLIGISTIQIKNGKAKFLDSPCPNKTCVACTAVSQNLEWVACLPNQIFIRIDKESNQKKSQSDVSSF